MTAHSQQLIIRRPDDWHVHLRDGVILNTVLPYTSAFNGRAIVMPNLVPPVTSIAAALDYRKRILSALPVEHRFTPLMTCYLTDFSDPDEIEKGASTGVFIAAKLYPMHATTNSNHGVTSITAISNVLERMQKIGMPLLIHGEVTNTAIDIFDREARFIESVLEPMRKQFPELKVVLEHITTQEAAQYIEAGDEKLGATITPQHLMFNRNHMLVGGVRPHFYCLPILKRNVHQKALRKVIASGNVRFFLGTDTAPHLRHLKETSCGCAGVFNAPIALSAYATVFEEIDALHHLEAFCSENGPRFYGLPFNENFITLVREPWKVEKVISIEEHTLVPFLAGKTFHWRVKI
ncbi:dihydroorotase [Pantoea sp. Nvir]|uniref:dihydroorotase n=1 Tax=Pantoea sp. Nvir TaxID=2576760 RepID=UPI00135CE727|nr:dihydroorotase [Pantoea sp. Nvir]MXP66266.1 dihydroorotase [Pantoea sp. Nvir]